MPTEKYYPLQTKYVPIVGAILGTIENELCRVWWNKHQKEMLSPFRNTGNSFKNDTFAVYAHDWNENFDSQQKPNFVWKNVRVYWYKHFRRGLEVYSSGDDITLDTLADMLNECLASLKENQNESDGE